jgi:hypothetical protein
LVSCSTWVSIEPPLGGGEVVVVGFGVLVWLGFVVGLVDGLGDGFGVRDAPRLGAVVERVGVGVARGVLDGVRLGVADGFGVALGVTLGRGAGVSTGGVGTSPVVTVSGSSWLAGVLRPSRVRYQPPPASSPSTTSAARIGPVTPRRFARRGPAWPGFSSYWEEDTQGTVAEIPSLDEPL